MLKCYTFFETIYITIFISLVMTVMGDFFMKDLMGGLRNVIVFGMFALYFYNKYFNKGESRCVKGPGDWYNKNSGWICRNK